ncbi:Protein EPIDERMAL PATTERNING FACTOR 1 [Capsicum annuum]|nr:Protein EPIDERMAL PATTERNING FACTOR 1 [Capsicum annuum]KAF3618012.1 Protein EPIDERMAL PATTERNING FACTOR 1 [Capsicum annuum]
MDGVVPVYKISTQPLRSSLNKYLSRPHDQRHVMSPPRAMRKRADTLAVAGSRLPDCSHACGSCKPCRLVMVSFVCSSLEEAETCPVAYKCMCHNKSYPVP